MLSAKASVLLLVLGLYSQQNAVDGFRVLAFYHGTWDLAHISFVGDCNRYFPSIQSANGFTYESTTDWSKINDNYLQNYDVVMFLDDLPSDWNQRNAFQRYIENGGGFIGYHVSAFTQSSGEWSWYHNTFLGSGDYEGNTWRPTSAVLKNEVPSHPVLARLPEKFSTQPNEWYKWTKDLTQNNNIQILLSIHPDSFPLGTGPNPWEIWYDGYYPVVWTNKNYNMLYINMGHNDIKYEGNNEELSHTFDNEVQNRLIIDGLKWLASRRANKKSPQNPLFTAFKN
jgi:type 1 glutamine amidotransferase